MTRCFFCLVLALLLGACGGARAQGAGASCTAQCPAGSHSDGKGCVWDASKVTCPKGSRFQGETCVPTLRTGHVDLQRLIEITQSGKKRKAALKEDFDKKQRELDKESERLKDEKQVIDSGKLSGDTRKLREKKYAEDLAALQATYLRFQEDLKNREQALIAELLSEVRTAAGKVGEREGMSAMFADQETLWVSGSQAAKVSELRAVPRTDLTDAVAKEVDHQTGAGP